MMHATKIPKSVWALGFVSLFMDISSEIIHGLLPVFMVSILGASMVTVGFIEGLGEALALIIRVFSGALSDRLQQRKGLIVAGYLLGTLSKPLFAMAQGVGLVLTARSLDRIGKGLRGAPRDALVADLTPATIRGAAYGLRQSLDSVGAFVGPLLGIILMLMLAADFRAVFWLAIIPGLIAVLILILFVQEPTRHIAAGVKSQILFSQVKVLTRPYWIVLGIGMLFTLARFSEAFMLLRAQGLGLAVQWVPVILIVMSLCYALTAYPVGKLSDRIGRTRLLYVGLLILILADVVLAMATSVGLVMVGAALWGMHMGFTQGLFAAMVADSAAPQVRGTAFGIYGLATGITVFIASILAGGLWDLFGPQATFVMGMAFAVIALAGYWLYCRMGEQRCD